MTGILKREFQLFHEVDPVVPKFYPILLIFHQTRSNLLNSAEQMELSNRSTNLQVQITFQNKDISFLSGLSIIDYGITSRHVGKRD